MGVTAIVGSVLFVGKIMDHPLVNPSLTPLGFVFPIYRKRLEHVPLPGSIDGDRVAAEFWELKNRTRARGERPAETIIHEVLPPLDLLADPEKVDFTFEGRGYRSRDIMVLSTFMQWFGTSVGNVFLTDIPFDLRISDAAQEFRLKLKREEKRHPITAILVHECTDACGVHSMLFWVCKPERGYTTKRDHAVVDALMTWLGMPQGRAYIEEYKAYRQKAFKTARENAKLLASVKHAA